jgi:hypothetical protein
MAKKWSPKLRELSGEYFEYDGIRVKTTKGGFGILNIDYRNKIYTISFPHGNAVSHDLTFHSADEMINAGRAVD